MSKIGYPFLAKGHKAREEDLSWMKDFGCDGIVFEEGIQERLRPQGRCFLTLLQPGDEIFFSGLSNVMGIREIGALLDPCRVYKVQPPPPMTGLTRRVSLSPKQRSANSCTPTARFRRKLCPPLRSETMILRTGNQKQKKMKSALLPDRGKSRIIVFRVLKRNYVEPTRLTVTESIAPQ